MKCQHCRAARATESFEARLCAEGRCHRVIRLCAACNADLNALVLDFIAAPRAESKIAAYRAKQGLEAA